MPIVLEQTPTLDDVAEPTGSEEPAAHEVDPAGPWTIPPFPHPLRSPLRAIGWIGARLFGIASLVLVLGIVAAVPILGFYSLGYLLDAEGRIGRSGRIRDGFPLLAIAPRLGGMLTAIGLFLLPVILLNGAARDAVVIDPDSPATARMETLAGVVTVLTMVHLCLSLARGGRFTNFLRPIKNVRWLWTRWREHDYWDTAERNVGEFVARLRLRELWWLGLRGFGVATLWLVIPSAILAATPDRPGGALVVGLIGSVLLGIVFSWVPILQARFAVEDRFHAGRELSAARASFRRAPLCWLLAMFVVYAFSLPLYLFRIPELPVDARWLVTIVFVATIWPTRFLTGWAYAKAADRQKDAHWLWQWGCWVLLAAVITAYVFLLFFTPFVVERGHADRFFHHAFQLPSPF